MPEEVIQDTSLVGEPTEPGSQEPIQDTQTQTPEPPKPEWANRYASPDQMWEDVKRFQSEATRAKNELEKTRQPQTAVQQPSKRPTEEALNQFVADPDNYVGQMVQQVVAPILAQQALVDYANQGHPEVLQPEFKNEMQKYVRANPAIIDMPDGADMVYLYVKSKMDAQRTAQATQIRQQATAQIEQSKSTDAFVEGSSAPARPTQSKITEGMSVAEMDAILDKQGIPWRQ